MVNVHIVDGVEWFMHTFIGTVENGRSRPGHLSNNREAKRHMWKLIHTQCIQMLHTSSAKLVTYACNRGAHSLIRRLQPLLVLGEHGVSLPLEPARLDSRHLP